MTDFMKLECAITFWVNISLVMYVMCNGLVEI